MTEESFTYLQEDDGTQSLLDTVAADNDVKRIVAEIVSGGFEDHTRASDELRIISAATSPAYTRHIALKTVELVGGYALLQAQPLSLPAILGRLRSFIMTYRGLRPWSEHVQFMGDTGTNTEPDNSEQ